MDSAEPVENAEVGDSLGLYRLERLLGAGSMARVFLASHVLLGRRVAIKVLSAAGEDHEHQVQRFLNEARVVNEVRHPCIVDISDVISTTDPPRLALVMEYVEGPSLKTLLRAGVRPSFVQSAGVLLQLLDALAAAHAAGVIHRDLKPDNLLLSTDPSADPDAIPGLKIVDFGVAKMVGASGRTATGMMIGTPAYMAPEQIAGKPPPSPATDVYAVGEILYELCTGARVFPAQGLSALLQAKLKGDLPTLQPLEVPGGAALLDLVRRCLSARPQDRPRLPELVDALLAACPEAAAATARPDPRRKPLASDLQTIPAPAPLRGTELETQPPLAIPPAATSPTLDGPHPAMGPGPEAIPTVWVETEPRLESVTPILARPDLTPADATLRPTPTAPGRAAGRTRRLAYAAIAVGLLSAAAALGLVASVGPGVPADPRPPEPVLAAPRTRPVVERERVRLSSSPAGALVEDLETGERLGPTPLELELGGAGRRLRLGAEGFEPEELTVARDSGPVHLTLRRRASRPVPKARTEAPAGKRQEEFPTW